LSSVWSRESKEILSHVAVNHDAERSSQLAAERAGVAAISLSRVLHRVKCLDLEFTFAVRGRSIENGFPRETVGKWNLGDTAMLITITTRFHLVTLSGVEAVASASMIVFDGARGVSDEM